MGIAIGLESAPFSLLRELLWRRARRRSGANKPRRGRHGEVIFYPRTSILIKLEGALDI